MCVCSKETLIRYEELPKFNGKRIESIYAVYENSRYEGKNYVADILYYNCYIHSWDCNKDQQKILKVKVLPKEFQPLFNLVTNKGKTIFVKYMWFRMDDSANGSFTDQTLDLSGWAGNATESSFSLYRGITFNQGEDYKYVISNGSALDKSIKDILGHSFKVEEVEFQDCGFKAEERSLDFATKFPYKHTPIQFIDKLAYPDEKLDSWRWLHGYPYRQPEGMTMKKHLRIWDSDLQVHLYVERVDFSDEAVSDLISISFKSEHHDVYGSESQAYCHIRRYNKGLGYAYVRYDNVSPEDIKNSVSLYRITRIVNSEEYKTKQYSK